MIATETMDPSVLPLTVGRPNALSIHTRMTERLPLPTVLKPTKYPLYEASSMTNETAEVKSMAEQVRAGRPTDVYEIAQNMLYGLEKEPPPHIELVKSGAKPVVYEGEKFTDEQKQGVEAVDFINGGEFNPQLVVTVFHKGDNNPYARWGRGGSVAYTHAVSEGMEVEISSSFNGIPWRGEISMVDIDEPGVMKMVLNYEYQSPGFDDKPVTRVRIKKPTTEFIARVEKLSEYFLPANPDYQGEGIVTKKEDAKYPVERVVVAKEKDSALVVESLLGWMPVTSQGKYNDGTITVDGLRLDANQEIALPWAVSGGENFNQYSSYHVVRSRDSARMEGSVERAIADAIRLSKSPELMHALVELHERENTKSQEESSVGYRARPIELADYSNIEVDPETAELFKKALIDRYGEVPLTAYTIATAKRARNLTERKVVVVSGLGDMFKKAGAQTVQDAIGITEFETHGSLNIAPSGKAEVLEQTKRLVKSTQDRVEFIPDEAGGSLQFHFNNVVLNENDFLSVPSISSPAMSALHLAAYGLNQVMEVYSESYLSGQTTHIDFERVNTGRRDIGIHSKVMVTPNKEKERLGTVMVIRSKKGVDSPLMRQDEESRYEGARLAQEFNTYFAEEQRHITPHEMDYEAMRLQLIAREEEMRLMHQKLEEATKAAEAARREQEEFLEMLQRIFQGEGGSGSARVEYSGRRANRAGVVENIIHMGSENLSTGRKRFEARGKGIKISPIGYYAENTAKVMRRTPYGIGWVNPDESFRDFEGIDSVPNNFYVKTIVELDNEWRFLPVRTDMAQCAYVGRLGVEVEQDISTGRLRARGEGQLELFQLPLENDPYDTLPPTEADYKLQLDMNRVQPTLRNQIINIRDGKYTEEEKAALVMSLWQKKFRYNSDPNIQRKLLAMSTTESEYAARLLNEASGICNMSAAGGVILLKAVGLAAQIEGGAVVGGFESSDMDTHAWGKFWDGKRWRRVEFTTGVVSQNVLKGQSEMDKRRDQADAAIFARPNRPSLPSEVLSGKAQPEIIRQVALDSLTAILNEGAPIELTPEAKTLLRQVVAARGNKPLTTNWIRRALVSMSDFLLRRASGLSVEQQDRALMEVLRSIV